LKVDRAAQRLAFTSIPLRKKQRASAPPPKKFRVPAGGGARVSQTVQALDRGLSILDYLADHPQGEASLSELTGFLAVDKSAVFRMLKTLEGRKLVAFDSAANLYRLGAGVYRLAAATEQQTPLFKIAAPHLQRINLATNEDTHLAIRSEDSVVFLGRKGSREIIGVNTHIGHREPLYCTAIGRALLANLPELEIHRVLDTTKLVRLTPKTLVKKSALRKELVRVRAQGHAIDDEERKAGVYCIAAPVFNRRREVIAAIGISGLKERMRPKIPQFIALIQSCAQDMSASLGLLELPAQKTAQSA
jgi:DNA-binding IclR family transcriptional regulator